MCSPTRCWLTPDDFRRMNSAPQRLILRNTLLLVGAQVLAAPLSILINAVAARRLGPTDFGQLYLATTFSSLAFLVVEWGQSGTLTGMVARDRSHAGQLLGSGLTLRLALLPVVLLTLVAGCALAGYDSRFLRVLSWVLLAAAFGTVASACQDIMRGYERTDIAGASIVAAQFLGVSIVVPTLLLIGNLTSFLIAQAACAAAGALVLVRLLPTLGVPRLSVSRNTCRALLSAGTSFLLFNLIVALQPNVDAVFLSKLASPEAIGWQAAARKLTGLLIFPASALTAALYPTLSRLFAEDRDTYRATTAAALRAIPAIALPIALCCALFPRVGIDLFGEGGYGPAAANLRILALFILLLYMTMPLSAALLAAGRQRAWATAQFGCVALSAVADPWLIPWFQSHTGNGGLGVCVSTVAGETMMVAAGLSLLPREVLDRTLWRSYGSIASSGSVMAAVALALSRLGPYAAAPAALIGYAACMWLTGGLDKSQLELLQSLVRRKPPAVA
jgi:O-antigen/teichoic acid export membrane protein